MSADIAENLWSLVCSCLKSYWAFHLFLLLIFFKLVAICTEFNLLNHICFVLFMIMDFPYICDHQVGYSAVGYSFSPRWFLTWYIYLFSSNWLHWWVLILHKTYDHWSVAVLTVTEHFIYSLLWFFFQIGCFLHWIQSVYHHLFCSVDDNGFHLYLWSPSALLSWWIFIVSEVVYHLVYLSIFSGLAALMSADIAQNLWSLVCSCLNSYRAFHLFPLLNFSNWLLSALNSIILPPFVLFSLW